MLTRSKFVFQLAAKQRNLGLHPYALNYAFSHHNHNSGNRKTFEEKLKEKKDHPNYGQPDQIRSSVWATETKHVDATPTSEDLIKSDAGLAAYMMRVYRTTGMSIASMFAGGYMLSASYVAMAHPMGMMLGGLALSIGGIVGFNRTPQIQGEYKLPSGKTVPTLENPTARKLLFAAIIAGNTMVVSPLIGALTALSPTIIPAAIGMSMLVMGGSSIYALRAKHGSFSGWTAGLYGGLLGVLGLNAVSLLTYMMIGPNIFSMMCSRVDTYFGIGLFTAFNIYDTQNAVEEYKQGKYDHLSHTINFYLNFVNLFVRFAEVIRSMFYDSD